MRYPFTFGLVLSLASVAALAQTPAPPPAPTDTVAPDIPGVVAGGTKVQFIKAGFRGTEGPLGLPDGTFIFTETQANQITRINPDGSTAIYLENTNGSNGLGMDGKGRLISVQTTPGSTRVGVIAPKGSEATLTDNFEGRAYGRPNDLVVAANGGIYFTEPGPNAPAGGDGAPVPPALPPAVYYLPPGDNAKAIRVADKIARPNGIMLSPDEKVLYVNDTQGDSLLAFDVTAEGTLRNRRAFAKYEKVTSTPTGISSGADGLAIDNEGRLYCASAAGVEVFSPQGQRLGTIPVSLAPQNIAFAGPDKKTLYIVGRGAAFKVQMLAAGYAGRAK